MTSQVNQCTKFFVSRTRHQLRLKSKKSALEARRSVGVWPIVSKRLLPNVQQKKLLPLLAKKTRFLFSAHLLSARFVLPLPIPLLSPHEKRERHATDAYPWHAFFSELRTRVRQNYKYNGREPRHNRRALLA